MTIKQLSKNISIAEENVNAAIIKLAQDYGYGDTQLVVQLRNRMPLYPLPTKTAMRNTGAEYTYSFGDGGVRSIEVHAGKNLVRIKDVHGDFWDFDAEDYHVPNIYDKIRAYLEVEAYLRAKGKKETWI